MKKYKLDITIKGILGLQEGETQISWNKRQV